jgi:DNA polymerase III delta subunit
VSYRNFLDEVKKGMPAAAYLLSSSDPFLHTEATASILNLVPPGERDFNFHAFDLMNTGVIPFEHILDVVNTVPFFAGRKFVVIENFQKLPKKDLKKLGHYLLNPAATSVIVLLYAGAAKKEVKDAVPGVKQIVLDVSERDIPAWVRLKAKAKVVEMTDGAVEYLIGTIGTDLGLLSSEIDKCALIGKATVEKEDIMDVVESKRTYNAFALIDAIRAKDVERAFRIYSVLRETEEPYSLLGALNWQFGRFFADSGSPGDRDYYRDVFDALQKADMGIKSSGGAYPVELLLVRLLRLSRHR